MQQHCPMQTHYQTAERLLPPRHYPADALCAASIYSPVQLPSMVPRDSFTRGPRGPHLIGGCARGSVPPLEQAVHGITPTLLDSMRPGMLNETLRYLGPSCVTKSYGAAKLTTGEKMDAARQLFVNTKARPFQPAPSNELRTISSYHARKLAELHALNPARAKEFLATMPVEAHAKYELARQLRL